MAKKKRKKHTHWFYMGCVIDHDRTNAEGMYYARTSQGRVMAHTLAEMRDLIREREKPQKGRAR